MPDDKVQTAHTKQWIQDSGGSQYSQHSAVQKHWAAGLAQYARATSDCLAGTSTSDPDLLAKSAAELGAGNTEIAKATASIKALQSK
jgi:hypothetical protein